MKRRDWLALAAAGLCRAAEDPLVVEWRKIAAGSDGTVGAAALDARSGRRVSLRGDEPFPLASVCKLPMAMIAFDKFPLTQEVEIPAEDVVKSVSPIGDQWPKRTRWMVDEMVELMVARSDNTAVQTFFRMEGGGAAITARLRAWKVEGMRIDRDERSAGRDASTQGMRRFLADPRDTATPNAAVDCVRALSRVLPDAPARRLRAILESTTTGPGRIKGLLPAGTVVGHKTGTTGSQGKLNGSTNDVGYIRLPDGGELAVAFFLKGSSDETAAREKTIARLARAAYDWATKG